MEVVVAVEEEQEEGLKQVDFVQSSLCTYVRKSGRYVIDAHAQMRIRQRRYVPEVCLHICTCYFSLRFVAIFAMLTSSFDAVQDHTFVVLTIRVPYTKVFDFLHRYLLGNGIRSFL